MAKTAETPKRRYRMDARARRVEETAQRIREVALEQFLSRSFDEVTLAEIADGTGVTVPTLISHFGRKEDLFVAALEDWGGRMVEQREEAPVGDHTGAIRNLFDRLPPYDPQTYGAVNYNPTYHLAGAIGRFYTVGARLTW